MGVLNYETRKVHCKQDERYDAKAFLEFLKKAVALYLEGKIVGILDNPHIYHAKLLMNFLGNTHKLQLIFLLPYSPKLNLIEGLCKWLKDSIINNTFYPTIKEIKSAVQNF